jgi:hypothetical protein
MHASKPSTPKRLRVCYVDTQKRLLSAKKIVIEERLHSLGAIDFVDLASIEDPRFSPCDLLIVSAESVPEENFAAWVSKLKNQMEQQSKIWTPALIVSEVGFDTLDSLLKDAVQSNWYFDIVSLQHLDSLPIRVANLLRIHDHLHELKRYNEQLSKLNVQVETLEKQVAKLK